MCESGIIDEREYSGVLEQRKGQDLLKWEGVSPSTSEMRGL